MHSFCDQNIKDIWYIADPDHHLRASERSRPSPTAGKLTYLGGRFFPWFGIHHSDLKNRLQETLQRHRISLLKLHQKLMLLSTYIVLHFSSHYNYHPYHKYPWHGLNY